MAYHKDMIAAPSRQTEPSLPPIVSAQEWQAKLCELARQEKVATTARQALAAARRRMPMTLVEKDYRFLGPKGEMSLPDLFAGRQQLISSPRARSDNAVERSSGSAEDGNAYRGPR